MRIDRLYPLAIVGGGAAGTMAMLRAVLNNDDVLVFPGNAKHKKKSRDKWVGKVENMPAHFNYKKGIEDPSKETLEWIRKSSFSSRLHFQEGRGVEKVEKLEDGIFQITDDKGNLYWSKFLLLCTGVMDVQPLIGGSIKPILPFANIQSVDYCLRCDGHHLLEKNGAVIGYDSGAAWVAIMLYERYLAGSNFKMFVLTNGRTPSFSADVIELLSLYQIEVLVEPIVTVLGKAQIGLDGFKLENGKVCDVQLAFVSEGMIVYNDLAKNLGVITDERGFVVADENGQTSVDGLYVSGDLKAKTKKQIYTAWDNAVSAVDHVNMRYRTEKRKAYRECREWPKNLS